MSGVFVPPSLRHFEPRRLVPGNVSALVALEYDLVEAARPGLLVDAGASEAVSFYAFCQSLHDHDIDGTAYAIDTWDGPPSHPDLTYEAIEKHGRLLYPGISYMMRMPPEPAFCHFGEQTVDFLRLDGPRFGDDPTVAEWLARVRPGGLVVVGRANEEGARRAWEVVKARGPSCVFAGGAGLGLCLVEGGTRKELPPLLRLALVEGQVAALNGLYAHAREHHRLLRAAGKMAFG